jgi:hypothetical protein
LKNKNIVNDIIFICDAKDDIPALLDAYEAERERAEHNSEAYKIIAQTLFDTEADRDHYKERAEQIEANYIAVNADRERIAAELAEVKESYSKHLAAGSKKVKHRRREAVETECAFWKEQSQSYSDLWVKEKKRAEAAEARAEALEKALGDMA